MDIITLTRNYQSLPKTTRPPCYVTKNELIIAELHIDVTFNIWQVINVSVTYRLLDSVVGLMTTDSNADTHIGILGTSTEVSSIYFITGGQKPGSMALRSTGIDESLKTDSTDA